MSIFLAGHPGEQFHRRCEIGAERFGKIAINAYILLLGGDGKGTYLRLVQVTEAHVGGVIIFNRRICPNDESGSFFVLSGLSA